MIVGENSYKPPLTLVIPDLYDSRLRSPSYSGRSASDFDNVGLPFPNSEPGKRTQYANGQLLPDQGMPDSRRRHPTPSGAWTNRAPLEHSQRRFQLHCSKCRVRGRREPRAEKNQGAQDVADTAKATKKKHDGKQSASPQERITRRVTTDAVPVSYWYANFRAVCHIRAKSNGRRHTIRPGVYRLGSGSWTNRRHSRRLGCDPVALDQPGASFGMHNSRIDRRDIGDRCDATCGGGYRIV